MHRLEVLSPDLAAKLRETSKARRHAACLAACELAVATAQVEDPIVTAALRQLRAGGPIVAQQRAELDALVAKLDDEYFALQEACDTSEPAVYLRVFAKARAVAAVSFAGTDAPDAALDAIYEAAAALGDEKEKLLALVESESKQDGSN